ncbi:MAG: T9SS type A sorting domain-containing protein [Bacteroidales bacterium]|nr:T9SS type A sorting domain-containing protein [Bacteroidales bacterium]
MNFSRILLVPILILTPYINFAQVIQDPDDFHGPRTKWVIYPDTIKGISRHSIIPQVDGTISEWLQNLEKTGCNSATINLENNSSLIKTAIHPTFELTPTQIAKGEFTPAQRDEQLLDFLQKVQQAIDNKEVNGNIRFHVHQRLYPNNDQEKEQIFIDDFSGFINKAVANNVDHLLAGIRLGEHGREGRNYILDFSIRMAKAINANTNGWLKTHGFEMSGDEYGRRFTNIHNVALSATFFEEISKETGYFAFCYKAFNCGGRLTELNYPKSTVAEWEDGLLNGLGLADLITFIKQYRDSYPLHANVIFIGDSGDALKLVGNKEYQATTKILTEAGVGFKGIIGVNGFRRPDKGTEDNNLYFYDALDGKTPVTKSNSIKRWQAWPYNDANTSSMHTVLAMSNLHGIIEPSGPVLVENNANIEFKITPEDGYLISKILVDNVETPISSTITLNNVTASKSIQVLYEQGNNTDQTYQNEYLHVFPNPVNKGENITLNTNSNGDATNIQLHSIAGNKIKNLDISTTGNFTVLSTGNLSQGIYFLQITVNNKHFIKKIIIE